MTPDTIHSDACAVLNIAQHIDELRARALAMPQTEDAERRGYLSPSEDEATRHLLISYWQMRSALLETVYFYRDHVPTDERERRQAFVVAFAGAMVLIDAARFLREQFHHRYVIRAKLNEPEPHFGIPAGVYETVQASLTSPLHLWHVYHAAQFWSSNQESLRELGADVVFDRLLGIIDRLGHRLAVSINQCAAARLRHRTRQLCNLLTKDLFFQAIYGLQKAAASVIADVVVRRGHVPQLPAGIIAGLRELLAPGDVLVTRKEHALTNYFLPGYWPHAAVFLGTSDNLTQLGLRTHPHVTSRWTQLDHNDQDEPRRVLEAMKDGVLIRSLRSPTSVDAIAVLRPQLPESKIAEALARGLFHEGKAYDFDFDFTRSDRLVCTEVVYRSYEGIGPIRFRLLRRAGRQTLAAEDLVQMALDRDGFAPVAAYCSAHNAGLQTGSAAESLLRRTLVGSPA